MNPKNTALWLGLAAGLFAFIFFYQRHVHNRKPARATIFPTLKVGAIKSVQVLPQGRALEIRADRTGDGWQLAQPVVYPAQNASIEALLSHLQQLVPATKISEREIKNRFNADEEYGFTTPQASIILQPGDYHFRLGKKTAPGDQVFLQVVGVEGIYVVGAELLKLVPQTPDEWRDTTFVGFAGLAFDHIAVTNGTTIFTLHNDPTNNVWRMLYPLDTRADTARVEAALEALQTVRIRRFISDDPKADLEPVGLQPPKLEIALSRGTNLAALLQFGQSPTNNPNEVYGRRVGQKALVTVSAEPLAPWRRQANEFRDHHLVSLVAPVAAIEVRGEESFSVQRQGSNTWCIVPSNQAADPDLVTELIGALSSLEVVDFVKDLVTDPDLPTYGLASPTRQYVLKSTATNSPGTDTNTLVELSFGTNQQDKVFARRSDERSVYAVRVGDLQRLPSASWQLRDRQIWNFSENDVARVTIHQGAKVRQVIRNAPYKWSLAPGSQGSVEDLPVEETVRGLCHLSASSWVARGDVNRPRYGFLEKGHKVTLELKNEAKLTVEFGGEAPSNLAYAAVNLDGQAWIFEFPFKLYRDVVLYLSIPANVP
jgi:hypothetical protein